MKVKDSDLIDKYLENELTEEELKVFKEKYNQDFEFASEVNALSRIYISLDAASRLSIDTMANKPDLRQFVTQRKTASAESKTSSKTLLKIAAILIPLIGLGGFIFPFVYTKPSPDNLFRDYYDKPLNLATLKGAIDEKTVDFAMVEGNMEKLVAGEISKSVNTAEDYFWFGIYCMESHRYTEAIQSLTLGIGSKENPYRDDCEWYLALCHLKTGNKTESLQILKSITENKEHPYYKEAVRLSGKL